MTRPDVMELTVTFRLADLLRLVPQETLAEIAAYMPKSALPNIGDLLTGCRLRVILNSREGKLYWNFPLLALFDSTHTITEDTWISMDLGSDAGEGITEENWAALLADGELHIGELLYRQLLDNSANNEAGAVLAYLRFMQTFSTIQNLFGPETIEEKDGTLTWHLPADIVNAYLMQNLYVSSYAGEDSEADLWKELDVALSVSQAGEIDLHAAFRLDMDAIAQTYADRYSYYDASEAMLMRFVMGWLDARYTAQASFQGNKGSAAMELHWKNQMKLTVETETVRELTDELPAEQPPEGSNVIEG